MKSKILIVEDEIITAEDLRETLIHAGYEVCGIATSEEEAIKMAKKEKPDLVLVDIVLGKDRIGGIKAAREISSIMNIPVIYITAYSDEEIFKQARIAEPFGYLIKPVDERELKMNIQIALFKSRVERELKRVNREKEEAIENLRNSESLMKAILSSMTDSVFVMDDEGRFIFYNASENERFLMPEDFVGKVPREVLPPQISELFEHAFQKNLRGESAAFEYELEIKGKKRYFSARQSPVIIAGKFSGAVIVSRDITEIKESERKIRESEEKYRSLFENVPVGLYRTTSDGEIIEVNPAFIEILGYSSLQEIKRVSPADFYRRKMDRERWKKEMKDKDVVHMEVEYRRKDGKIIWVKESARAIRDESGKVIYYEGSIQDITKSKNLEEELSSSLIFMKKLFKDTVRVLGSVVEVRDPYTAGHQRRVTELAVAIAQEMGLKEWRIEAVRVAGFLHDIGKLAVPSEILVKPTKLTEHEYMLIKAHPQVGFELLRKIDFPWPIAEIILQHHERVDGSGYPKGLKNGEILLEARIIAVADVVEAMSSHRPYRAALGIDKALEEISSKKGSYYDDKVVEACLRVFEKGFKFEREESAA